MTDFWWGVVAGSVGTLIVGIPITILIVKKIVDSILGDMFKRFWK